MARLATRLTWSKKNMPADTDINGQITLIIGGTPADKSSFAEGLAKESRKRLASTVGNVVLIITRVTQ